MKINLTTRIFIGMLLGILVGHLYRETHPDPADFNKFAENIQILSDIFLRLIKMIIAPLVFSTLVYGVAKVGDFKSVGRIGLKTILYFQFATILALALGLSSLASEKVRIESLFIDEGFGSLDPKTLETALSTLDSLQSAGRKVGLISHVPGLAERIGVQVLVERQGQGASTVRVVAGAV